MTALSEGVDEPGAVAGLGVGELKDDDNGVLDTTGCGRGDERETGCDEWGGRIKGTCRGCGGPELQHFLKA